MGLSEMIARMRERTGRLNSKTGKILGVLLLSMLMATASASVFVTYYGDATATVQTPDVQLVAGTDHGGSGYPSASVVVSATDDYAAIGISLFASATNTPQPATYFTDLLNIDNPSATARTVNSVTISNIVDTNSILGSIVVYYCTSQTDDPANNNVGSFAITSTTGGEVLGSSQALGAGVTHYIEVVAYAADTATTGQAVTFDIAIEWA
jgi:hypothetical protein